VRKANAIFLDLYYLHPDTYLIVQKFVAVNETDIFTNLQNNSTQNDTILYNVNLNIQRGYSTGKCVIVKELICKQICIRKVMGTDKIYMANDMMYYGKL
jgi:hypothetical protein